VFFHFDGDVPWSRKKECRTREQFTKEILDQLALILREKTRTRPGLNDNEIQLCLSRLVCVVPYYSIEAWTYQNTERLVHICKRYCGHKHAQHTKKYEPWLRNPNELDEVTKPKDNCCLGGKYNHELVSTSFPWARLAAAKKSFADFVNELQRRPEVVSILAITGGP
jgi:hypothetical protein